MAACPHVQKTLVEFNRELVGELASRPNHDEETALKEMPIRPHSRDPVVTGTVIPFRSCS
jgi:hypothetical protein